MAITNAQQYQQLVNKPANDKRPGYKGRDLDYQMSGGKKGSTFETYRGGKNIGVDNTLAAKFGTPEQKEKANKALAKGNLYSTSKNQNLLEKANTTRTNYNRNYKKKQLTRYQQAKINELNAKLSALGLDFYGDTEETYEDFIKNYAPSITEFGPGGTGKYSQEFIDDVLSGKRKPPESFVPIDLANVPGGLLTKGLAAGANVVGKGMAGPTTMEELMELYSGDKNSYTRARDLDIDTVTSKEMMEEFEPNRFKLENPPTGGDNASNQDPCKGPNPPAYCFIGEKADETMEAQRNLGGLAPLFGGSIYNFDNLADGGRAGMMDGGMMDDDPTGGIMDLESGRQMYFLGKLVKKAKRAVKKVVKSPLGKAALFGLGAYYMPGFGIKATGGFPNFAKPGGFLSKILTKGGDKALSFDNLSVGKATALGFGIPLALDALGVGKDDDDKMDLDEYYRSQGINIADIRLNPYNYLAPQFRGTAADGGLMRMGYQEGGDAEPVAKKTMPLIDMDGKEKDYRETGGFVDMGRMERADDVPARLSKNEFVFTADAVRNAGEGDIDKGAEVMYNMMKNLEAGGEVSEESQGLEGARNMFQTSQRLEEVL